ncbi:MAG TPA: L,D-transpeptidase/peptidoglycan binding protein [Thermoleophilaceae bacterium]|nr:L,D-transpeptidase/peptidoglycan binding protein [Thermoleophilaceae bacterium]
MRHRWFILVAVVLLILIGGAVAAYAYDSSREDLIAEGVTIAGVDVGGMKSDEARALVRRELQEPLEQPISVVRGKTRFNLSAEDAGVKADVGGMVDEAVKASRDGSIFSRVARDVTGGEEDVQVPPRVSYSTAAVEQLVERVERKLNRPARDAEVSFPSLEKVKEQKGRKVKGAVLEQRVAQALTVPGVERRVRAPVRIIKPKVTQAQLADKYPVVLIADRYNFKLRLYRNLQLAKEYTVAVGAVGFDTPAGLYHIQNKAVDPAWSVPDSDWAGDLAGTVVPGGVPENPLKARWLGIYDGAGIHGTDQTYSLGTAASHGCIRMAIPDVIEVYDQVPVGAPIYIA